LESIRFECKSKSGRKYYTKLFVFCITMIDV